MCDHSRGYPVELVQTASGFQSGDQGHQTKDELPGNLSSGKAQRTFFAIVSHCLVTVKGLHPL